MRPEHVELAGGVTIADIQANRRAVLARAPKWWRERAEAEYRRAIAGDTAPRRTNSPARSTPQPERSKPATYAGWLYGVCAPGVSTPAYSPNDGKRLREQFTPKALAAMVRRAHGSGKAVRLEWKHGGIGLATSADLGLVLRVHELYGLEFEARLAPSKFADQVLRMADEGKLGVSLGYRLRNAWYVERNGERLRIVDDADLDHVALIPYGDGLSPCFSGARAYGKRGHSLGCSPDVRDRARQYAYRLLLDQARATP